MSNPSPVRLREPARPLIFYDRGARLSVEIGGLWHPIGPFWVADGLHLWWGARGVHAFWRRCQWGGRFIVDRLREYPR